MKTKDEINIIITEYKGFRKANSDEIVISAVDRIIEALEWVIEED